MNRTLLFLCTGNSALSRMAERFARAKAPKGIVVASAGTRPADRVHPLALEVMTEAGFGIDDARPKPLGEVSMSHALAVIALSSAAAEECPLFLPGHPPLIRWNLPDPSEAQGSLEARREIFRKTREEIRRLVNDLFDRGYLEAIGRSNREVRLVLDSIFEGIIVHDLQRRITYFNAAAERVTGLTRGEVEGRDCKEVFPEGFCGGHCSFTEGAPAELPDRSYPLRIVNRKGETRELEMKIRAIVESGGKPAGILAAFRDLTREQSLARRLGEIEQFSGIIGRDPKMLEVFDLIRSVADSMVSILIQGESGTGKELVAAAIHQESARQKKLFVPVNCGALPEGLLESELFGHVRGAFTGAVRDKKGRFELAQGGTLFLDEIGDISPAMQVKLLRVLQDGAFERVGGTDTLHADARIISATNKDLKAEIRAGRFREDLYYRLCVMPIHLPPLRERRGDIPLLVDHFLKRMAEERNREPLSLAPAALDALLIHEWPGNVRELQNALQYAHVKCRGENLEASHLPPHLQKAASNGSVSKNGGWRKLTPNAVERALAKSGGNKARAARILGVGRATLYRFLQEKE